MTGFIVFLLLTMLSVLVIGLGIGSCIVYNKIDKAIKRCEHNCDKRIEMTVNQYENNGSLIIMGILGALLFGASVVGALRLDLPNYYCPKRDDGTYVKEVRYVYRGEGEKRELVDSTTYYVKAK